MVRQNIKHTCGHLQEITELIGLGWEDSPFLPFFLEEFMQNERKKPLPAGYLPTVVPELNTSLVLLQNTFLRNQKRCVSEFQVLKNVTAKYTP